MADNRKIVLEIEGKTKKLLAQLKLVKKSMKGVDDQTHNMRISTAGLRRSIGALRNNMLLVSFALGGTAASVGKLISAYGQQQLAEKKLQQALGFTSQALLTQASALQQTTAFGDEAIIGVQALIGAFTKDEEQIKALTKTTLDLAAAKGMELTAAADLVSKSFGSSTNALSRYGIQVEGAVGSTERLENLTGNVAALFGGQASAQADTMTGSIEQMKNALGDTAESMGGILEPATIAFSKSIKKAAEGWTDFFTELKESEMETAVRHLREMGAAAEDIAMLEQFVNMEKHTDALLNSSKKLKDTFADITGLHRDEVLLLGGQANMIEHQEGSSRVGWELAKEELATRENITALMKKLQAETRILYGDGRNITKDQHEQIGITSGIVVNLQKMLLILSQRERAEKNILGTLVEQEDLFKEGGEETFADPGTEFLLKRMEEYKKFANTHQESLDKYEKEQQFITWLQSDEGYAGLAEKLGLFTDAQKEYMKAAEERRKGHEKDRADYEKFLDDQDKTREKQRQQVAKDSMAIGRLAMKDKEAAKDAAIDKIAAYAMTAAAKQMEKIITEVPFPFNIPLAAAGGLAIGAAVGGLADNLKAAQYGMNEVVDEPTLILAGEAGAEQVSITPLESPNIEGVQGGGASVVVNVSGNVLTSDFVEGELADNIREAVRRGTDFGIG